MPGKPLESTFWKPENQRELENLLASGQRESTDPAIALFDWDHTLFHGDIGDSLFAHMVMEDHLFCPEKWELTPFLTPQATLALDMLTSVHGDGRLRTRDCPELRHELFSIYFRHRTTANLPAFSGFDPTCTHPAYAWFAALCAGHSPAGLQSLTDILWEHLLHAAPGSGIPLPGDHPKVLPDWGRPVTPLVELYFRLLEAGITPWIVSASPQFVVEACARKLGLSRERIIGVRNTLCSMGETLGLSLIPCGHHSGMIPYHRGKRCWVQHLVFGKPDPDPDHTPPELACRIRFAAGDSDGDLSILEDARLRLVIAHSENRAVSRARVNPDNRWMLNRPLFSS